jgi:hypothetical protein
MLFVCPFNAGLDVLLVSQFVATASIVFTPEWPMLRGSLSRSLGLVFRQESDTELSWAN